MAPGELLLVRREQALADEIQSARFVSDFELCVVSVKNLLNLWERTPEYAVPGRPVDCTALAANIR